MLGVAGRAAQEERAFEGHEDMIGEGVGVADGDAAALGSSVEEAGDLVSPDLDGVGDQVRSAVGDQLLLGEDRDVEAAALGGHELVCGVFEAAHEGDDSLGRVLDLGGLLQRPAQLADVGRDIAFRQRPGEVELGVEVVEERALGRAHPLEDLVERGGREAVLDDQVLRGVEDPLAVDGPVFWHKSVVPDWIVCYKQTAQSVTRRESTMSAAHFWQSGRYVSDGGLETDLIFNRGVDLPEFASFPLVEDEAGRAHLRDYYDRYAAIARRTGAGLTLESPTWRASRDWGAKVGYDAVALDRANRAAIALLRDLRASYDDVVDVRIIGAVGPRGDGYVAEAAMTPEQATEFHVPQVEAFADTGVDVVGAYTMTTAAEGLGVARAARRVGLPVLIGFTVETDGRLPDGTTLAEAIARLEAEEAADGFIVNCAHPTHIAPGLQDGEWLSRIVQVNPNASTMSHAELDEAEELDPGDLGLLTSSYDRLRAKLPNLAIVGGCCGTDATHVAAMCGL